MSAEDIKPGDIWVCEWGWEQTNVDFYKVIKSTEKSVVLAPIASDKRKGNVWGSFRVMPAKDRKATGPAKRYRIRQYSATEIGAAVNDYGYAVPWDGTPREETTYA